jgi:hypothetical protein
MRSGLLLEVVSIYCENAIVISIPATNTGMQQLKTDSLDPRPVTIKVAKGDRDRLRLVPGWQAKLRVKIKEIIQENGDGATGI